MTEKDFLVASISRSFEFGVSALLYIPVRLYRATCR
jgi:hypothetical protein